MAIEFGSKEANRVLRRAYLKEHKQEVIDSLRQVYNEMTSIDAEINSLRYQRRLLKSKAAEIRQQHGITVEDEMMMM